MKEIDTVVCAYLVVTENESRKFLSPFCIQGAIAGVNSPITRPFFPELPPPKIFRRSNDIHRAMSLYCFLPYDRQRSTATVLAVCFYPLVCVSWIRILNYDYRLFQTKIDPKGHTRRPQGTFHGTDGETTS